MLRIDRSIEISADFWNAGGHSLVSRYALRQRANPEKTNLMRVPGMIWDSNRAEMQSQVA